MVDTSLFETAVHWVEGAVNAYVATGNVTKRHGTGANVIVPYQVFQASDLPFVIAAGNDRLFARCAKVMGHPEWGQDPAYATGPKRVANKVALVSAMQAIIGAGTRDAWIERLEAQGVPCAAVNDIGELARSEQFAEVDMMQALPETGVKVVGLPISFDSERPLSQRPAPTLGQHNAELLGR